MVELVIEPITGKAAVSGDNQNRYQPMVPITVSFALGIVLNRWFCGWDTWLGAVTGVSLLAWFACWGMRRYSAACAALFMALVSIGASWHGCAWSRYPVNEIGRRVTEQSNPLVLRAMVRTEPARILNRRTIGRQSELAYSLELAVLEVRDGLDWIPASGKVTCSLVGDARHLRVGDRLQVWGYGQRIEPPGNPGEFHAANYFRSRRILVRLTACEHSYQVLLPAAGYRWDRGMAWMRRRASAGFDRHLPSRQARLAAAIVLGQRGSLDPAQREVFLVTGTLHLLVVSGFHVGIMASVVWFFGRVGWLKRRTMLWSVIWLVCGYALLTGARAPVSRAATLVVVMSAARMAGRPLFAENTLSLAALLLLLRNPSCLFDPGAQLSFLAVIALTRGWNMPWKRQGDGPLGQLVYRSRPWWHRGGIDLFWRSCHLIWISGLIWGVTAPLVLFYFHVVSYAGVVLTLVLYPSMVMAMLSGLLVCCFACLDPVASVAATICSWNLAFMEHVVSWVHHCPGTYRWAPASSVNMLLGIYAISMLVLRVVGSRERSWYTGFLVWLFLVVSGVVLPLIGGARWIRGDGLRCTFIDVGHGTSVLLEMPNGQNWLYDAGSMKSSESTGRQVAAVLWHRGIDCLDQVILSHADRDHYNALPYLLKRFKVRSVYMTPLMASNLDGDCSELATSLARHAIPLRCWKAGDHAHCGVVRVTVLHPPSGGVAGGDNANSLVLGVDYEDKQLILPGDVEGSGLATLVSSSARKTDILMAPHHGSLHSDPGVMSEWCQPEWVVMSAGRRSDSDQVKALYRARGARVWSTAEHGAVTIDLKPHGKQLLHQR